MNFFRTHITRNFSVGLLLAGLLLYFVQPSSGNTRQSAFALWLKSNLKASTSVDVTKQIQRLSDDQDEIESVIRKASEIVSAHAEDFELPLNSQSQDQNEVFRLLLKEWNAYQHASAGMGKAVIIKQAQPQSLLPVDGPAWGGKAITHLQNHVNTSSGFLYEVANAPSPSYHTSPLSGGTAIGAP